MAIPARPDPLHNAAISDAADRLREVRAWVDAAERVVVLTGAGISTDSGIPDFRGPNRLWTRNPEAEKMATLLEQRAYLSEATLRAVRNPGTVTLAHVPR